MRGPRMDYNVYKLIIFYERMSIMLVTRANQVPLFVTPGPKGGVGSYGLVCAVSFRCTFFLFFFCFTFAFFAIINTQSVNKRIHAPLQ